MTAGTAAGNNQACRHKYSVCPSCVHRQRPTDIFLLVRQAYVLSAGTGLSSVQQGGSFVMIRFSLDDCAGAVQLFGKDEAHHLMGKRHAG